MKTLNGLQLPELSKIQENKIKELKQLLKRKFPNLNFDESLHKYTLNGWELIPTTTFIKQFKKEFNSYYAAESKYKSNLKEYPDTIKDPAYYRKRWDNIRNEASSAGTRIHHFAEAYPHFEEPICKKEQGVLDFYKWLDVSRYVVLFTEFKLYDEEISNAGTIDLMLYDLETESIILADWKSNSKSIFEYTGNSMLLSPFSGYKETSFNEYSIQLSHYQYMLEKKGFKVSNNWIIWLSSSLKFSGKKGKKMQRVNSITKTPTFRLYECRKLKNKLSDYIELNKVKLQSQRVKADVNRKINSDLSLDLETMLPKLPKLPQFNDFNLKKQPAKKTYNKKEQTNYNKNNYLDIDIS